MAASQAAARTRPHRRVRTVLVAGLGALLLVATLAARQDVDTASATDLQRLDDALHQGCDRPAPRLDAGTGFALDGTVTEVTAPTARGPLLLTLEVDEWFRGPPLERAEVWLDPATLQGLTGPGGLDLGTGSRLLVSGRWGDDVATAAGCGSTRSWDRATARQWRADLRPAPVTPAGPVARYPDAGLVRGASGGPPDLAGVLVADGGCLYVQDGLTRWLPVLPAGLTGWSEAPARLLLAGQETDVGHAVRLGGVPAGGLAIRGDDGHTPADVRARLVDDAGVPADCDDDAPRFVVSEPPPGNGAVVQDMPAGGPVLQGTVAAARDAGLPVTTATGQNSRDAYGAHSWRVELGTEYGGEVLVHLETVAFLAWPSGYVPSDGVLRWSLYPAHAADLPAVPAGHQLAVVQRVDGAMQVLVRTPGRVVVSASTDVPTTGGFATDREGVDTLTALAVQVALSPGGAGS